MINAQFKTDEFEAFQNKFKQNLEKRPERIAEALSASAELVLARAKTHYLTGAALNVQTGRLRSSITKNPSKGAFHSNKEFKVFIGTDVPYGRYWEEGIKAYMIYPKEKKALRFNIGGKTVFAKKVFKPAQSARPWLNPSFQDERPGIINLLSKAGIILI